MITFFLSTLLSQDIKMEVPTDEMFGVAISEEVLNSAVRAWYNGTSAEFSFERDLQVSSYLFVKVM